MAERDRFELDLAAALRAYLEEAPTEVRPTELARQFATAYPHGTTTFGPWRLVAVPRRAWIPLLLAGLLAALVGGTLLVGSQLQRRLPAVVPPIGQLFECPPGSTPDEPGRVDQARPPEADMGIAFDRRAGRLVAVVAVEPVETWTFDVCTNTWMRMRPNLEPPYFEWAELVYDVDSDATILISNNFDWATPGRMWAYDLQADTWTEKRVAPTINPGSLAYDPVSGLVVAAYRDLAEPSAMVLMNYDVETDTWTPIQQANGPRPGDGVIAYDASVDRIVAYAADALGELETWLFDVRTGTWSRSNAQTPGIVAGFGWPRIEYDEAAKRTVIMSNSGAAAYDASANRWEMLVAVEPGWMPSDTMVYDPVNERLVGPADMAAIVAFDPGTREWTVLLEPGEGQPASTPATTPAPTSARTATPPGGTEKMSPTSPVPTASPTSTPKPTPTP